MISISLEMIERMSSTKAEHAGAFCRTLICYIMVLAMTQLIISDIEDVGTGEQMPYL